MELSAGDVEGGILNQVAKTDSALPRGDKRARPRVRDKGLMQNLVLLRAKDSEPPGREAPLPMRKR